MERGFPVTVSVEDTDIEVFVHALPPLGAVLNLPRIGTVKVKEIEFKGDADATQPLRINLSCVPILSF